MRLTAARLTPGVFSSTRCTRPWQAAHVIPETGMVMRTGAFASFFSDTSRLHNQPAVQHAHAAREVVLPWLHGLELDRRFLVSGQETPDAERWKHDFLGTAGS